jgi:hypothetical protein
MAGYTKFSLYAINYDVPFAIQTLKGAGSSHKQQVLPVYRGGKG